MEPVSPEERIARLRASRGQPARSVARTPPPPVAPPHDVGVFAPPRPGTQQAGHSLPAPVVLAREASSTNVQAADVTPPAAPAATDSEALAVARSSSTEGRGRPRPRRRPHPARKARWAIGIAATAGFAAMIPAMGSLSATADAPDDDLDAPPDPIPDDTLPASTVEAVVELASTTTVVADPSSTQAPTDSLAPVDLAGGLVDPTAATTPVAAPAPTAVGGNSSPRTGSAAPTAGPSPAPAAAPAPAPAAAPAPAPAPRGSRACSCSGCGPGCNSGACGGPRAGSRADADAGSRADGGSRATPAPAPAPPPPPTTSASG